MKRYTLGITGMVKKNQVPQTRGPTKSLPFLLEK